MSTKPRPRYRVIAIDPEAGSRMSVYDRLWPALVTIHTNQGPIVRRKEPSEVIKQAQEHAKTYGLRMPELWQWAAIGIDFSPER